MPDAMSDATSDPRAQPAAPAPPARILLVEDDPTVAEVVSAYLTRAGHTVDRAGDGPAALVAARGVAPDLVLLDLMLPGLDGTEVFARLRAERPELPVIMLTARGDEEDRVLGLAMGADDYVTKPFSPRELVLRVESLLRRAIAPGRGVPVVTPPGDTGSVHAEPRVLVDGDLRLDLGAHTADLAGRPLALTGREFDLLAFLLRHPGVAYSREDLLREVWGWDFGDQSTVTVHVRRLRTKVEPDPAAPVRLVTVWGVGYRWDPTP